MLPPSGGQSANEQKEKIEKSRREPRSAPVHTGRREADNSRMHQRKHRVICRNHTKKRKKQKTRSTVSSVLAPPVWLEQTTHLLETWSRCSSLPPSLPVSAVFAAPVYAATGSHSRCEAVNSRMRLPKTQALLFVSGTDNQKEHPVKRPGVLFGSPCLARTDDPAVNSRMLYRLS